MAKLIMVAVRDLAIQAFNRPFFVPAVGAAVRSFSDEVNRKAQENVMSHHPEDFELWELGTFDEDSGQLSPVDVARCIARAKDLVIVSKDVVSV